MSEGQHLVIGYNEPDQYITIKFVIKKKTDAAEVYSPKIRNSVLI